MALSRVTTWSSGQVLTASALNGEFNNILDNALSLISPLTGALNFNGNALQNLAAGSASSPGLYYSSDSNTGLFQGIADTIDFAAGGTRAFQIASASSAVNWLVATPAATAVWPTLSVEGTDANTGIRLAPKGTAYVAARRGRSTGQAFWPSFGFYDEYGAAEAAGIMQITAGTLDLVAHGRRVLQASGYVNATNYLQVVPSQSGQPVKVLVAGGDVNIDLQLGAAGYGSVTAATAFVPAALVNNPVQHGLYRENVPKGILNYDGAIASIYDSYNVTSVTDSGSGIGTITWDRDFAATTYSCVMSLASTSVGTGTGVAFTVYAGREDRAAGTTPFIISRDSNSAQLPQDCILQVVAFGDQ